LNNIKPKMLNGCSLSGEMYSDLISNYISAINQGACPNVEDAWLSICNNECTKALNFSISLYEKLMKENHDKLQFDKDELKEVH
jgi:hypothetical protein